MFMKFGYYGLRLISAALGVLLVTSGVQAQEAPPANGLTDTEMAAEPGGWVGAATLDDTGAAAMSDPFTYDASNIDDFKSIF